MERSALIRQLMDTFLEEMDLLLQRIDQELLLLDASPHLAAERAKPLLRYAHSLKGAARAVELEPVEHACHALESFFAGCRDERLRWTPQAAQTLSLALATLRDIAARLRAHPDPAALQAPELAALLPTLDALAAGQDVASLPAAASLSPSPSAADEAPRTARVSLERLDAIGARSVELTVALQELRRLNADLGALRQHLRQAAAALARVERASAASARLQHAQAAADLLTDRAERFAREHERLALSLDAEIQHLRLVPFAAACRGLERAAADVARVHGREVRLVLDGQAIAVDRDVNAALRTPLLQLVRNAVSHGVEPPDLRRRTGKPPVATLRVAASLRAGECTICVEDDGRGIDLDAVAARARAEGIPVPDDPRDLIRLIFRSGFSTSAAVSSISGRGVGLDIVRDQIERLQGSLDVRSVAGQGAAFTLTIPVRLSAIPVLLVEASGQTFALPVPFIERVTAVADDDAPARALAATLRVPVAPAPRPPRWRVHLTADGRRAAFGVDTVGEQLQALIKPLGPRLAGLQRFSGAALLPDGHLVLIPHVAELLRDADDDARAAELDTLTTRQPLHVLLVDDTATTRQHTRFVLEAAGFLVSEAAHGLEALDLLQHLQPDVIVSDVEMPRMGGLELLETLQERRHPTPLILITGLVAPELERLALTRGARAWIRRGDALHPRLLQLLRALR